MDGLALLDKTFERPAGFQLDLRESADDRPIVVRALFAASAARWVREERSFFTVQEETRPDGLLVTFRLRHERDLLHWLLGWGSQVQVLEPASLREQIAQEAEALLSHHRPV
jgi:predicted DNA-binding transcriptional regulator YafY